MKRIFLSLAAIICYLFAQGQEIVISEYKNDSSPSNEWTELLVISDNLDVRGWYMRDNVGSTPPPNNWQGGVVFKDVPLWKNLRSGTIIVIHHRNGTSYSFDNDKQDGYIELSAEDMRYFDTVCTNCSIWQRSALSIAQGADIVQLLDASGNHIHCFAHMPIEAGDFASLPAPKVCSPGSITNNENSVMIVPGLSLAAYSHGFDTDGSETTKSASDTKGRPNNSNLSINENQLFWRSLRQPNLINPEVYITLSGNSINLKWNNAEDAFPADSTTGYLLLIKYNHLVPFIPPVDGKVYLPGDSLGQAEVLYSGFNNEFETNIAINCGDSVSFRIYPYRFNRDYFLDDALPEYGKGRSYNENEFAGFTYVRRDIPDLKLISSTNTGLICEGDSVLLKAWHEPMIGDIPIYEWYFNNEKLNSQEDSIFVKAGGNYKFKVSNIFGCKKESPGYLLTVIPLPQAKIYINGIPVSSDSVYKRCPGTTDTLTGSGGDAFRWSKDGNILPGENSNRLVVSSDGKYCCIVSNNASCPDTSYNVTVKTRKIMAATDKNTLKFFLDQSESFQDQTFMIINSGEDEIAFNLQDISIPVDFSIIDPINPKIILTPGRSQSITVRFNPKKPGQIAGKLILKILCDFRVAIDLEGTKAGSNLTSDISSISFPIQAVCTMQSRDTTMILKNNGTNRIVLWEPLAGLPFEVISPAFPDTIEAQSTVGIVINYNPKATGCFQDLILIPYSNEGTDQLDTLKLSCYAEVYAPDFTIDKNIFNFSLKTCEPFRDDSLIITNISNLDLTIDTQPENKSVRFLNLPMFLTPKSSATLHLRYEPQSINDLGYHDDLAVICQPCNLSKQFTLNGAQEFTRYFTQDSVVDFGNIPFCGLGTNTTDTVKLFIESNSSDKPTIRDISVTGSIAPYLQLNLAKGQTLDSSNEIIINWLNSPEGNFTGNITLTMAPCDITTSFNISGSRSSQHFQFDSDFIEFPQLTTKSCTQDTIRIVNTGPFQLLISNISSPSPPFKLNKFSPSLPLTLIPGGFSNFIFDFEPDKEGIFADQAILNFSAPCDSTVSLSIRGVAIADPGKVLAALPQITAKPGQEIRIPLRITAIPPLDLNAAGVVGIEINLSYNPAIFNFENVIPGGSFINSPNTFITTRINSPGNITFLIDQIAGKEILSGDCIIIIGRTLLADKLVTDLKIDSLLFYSNEEINVEIINGLIRIDGGCAQDQRLVNVGGGTSLEVISDSWTNSNANISFNTIEDGRCILSIYDLQGKLAKLLFEKEIKAGNYNISCDLSELTQGCYYIVLSTSNIRKSVKLIKP